MKEKTLQRQHKLFVLVVHIVALAAEHLHYLHHKLALGEGRTDGGVHGRVAAIRLFEFEKLTRNVRLSLQLSSRQ